MQFKGKKSRFTLGCFPTSQSTTRLQRALGGLPFICLQTTLHVSHPIHLPKSMTIPQRAIPVPLYTLNSHNWSFLILARDHAQYIAESEIRSTKYEVISHFQKITASYKLAKQIVCSVV